MHLSEDFAFAAGSDSPFGHINGIEEPLIRLANIQKFMHKKCVERGNEDGV